MAEYNFNFAPDLENGSVHALIMRELQAGEILVSMRYNKKNGNTKVTTRFFEPFGELEKESAESELVNQLIEDMRGLRGGIERDRVALDGREAQILRKERNLDKKEKDHEKKVKQLEGERKQFDKERGDVIQKGLLHGVKSFFHRIK